MNINKMKREELELLSFTDIAYEILKIEKAAKSTIEIFRRISELLELSEEEFAAKIADFYTNLTTDKRFLALEDGNWDLKERHSTKVVIDDEDDMDIEVEDTTEDIEEEDVSTDYDENEDYADDDLEDLVVIDTDENEEE